MKLIINRLAIFILIMTTSIVGYSQTIVKGIVRDANTKQPIQSASVYFKGGKGVSTGEDGSYTLTTYNTNLSQVVYSYVGYKNVTKTITPFKEQEINVDLQLSDAKNTITVKAKRSKYSNKNNPAVELIRKVIENKDKNRITAYDYVSYEQYEKMELLLTKTPEKLMNNKLLKNFKFIFQNTDTTKILGRAMLPIYLDETLSQKYYRKNPEKNKTYILGEKKVNFGDYLDVEGISSYLDRLYENVDVYENNIPLLANQLLSPISDLAPTFYRFYLGDTTEIDGVKLVRLSFAPKNLTDMLFRGTLFITLDGNYSIQKLNMGISKNANINFVRELKVNQDFAKGPDGRYHVIMSNTIIEFSVSKNSQSSIVGERTVSLNKYLINQPASDSVYKGDAVVKLSEKDKNNNNNEAFWLEHRSPQLSDAEAKVYSNIDSLTNMKSFKTFMDIATLVLAGYKSFGPFEVGPVNAFYSFNPVEGFRLRVGGRTTPNFSKNIYLENYVAYGFKDQRWKFFGSAAYSFNKSSVYAYPLNFARVSFQRDTKIPGQELSFVVEDNFLLSFKRGKNDKWLYNDIWKAEYTKEFGKNFAYTVGFKNWKQTPAGGITYIKQNNGTAESIIPNLTTTELTAEIRWSPKQQFYQGKRFRIPIVNKYPIFKLRYFAGIKGLANGEYNYHNVNLNIEKRFYLSQLGFSDIVVEGSNIFGKVPYPLMTVHKANQTFSYQLYSYNLMNFLEFVSDHYVSVSIDHKFNGFFFNKIPLFKKLKWREAISGKFLWGGIRPENDPKTNAYTLKFPLDSDSGLPTTYSLSKQPYIEVSAGIVNIFKLIRIDFVKRLTYLDHPDVTQWGIRSRARIDF